MKKILGFTFGGLQKKMIALVMIMLGSLTPRIYERRIAPVFLRQILISYFS